MRSKADEAFVIVETLILSLANFSPATLNYFYTTTFAVFVHTDLLFEAASSTIFSSVFYFVTLIFSVFFVFSRACLLGISSRIPVGQQVHSIAFMEQSISGATLLLALCCEQAWLFSNIEVAESLIQVKTKTIFNQRNSFFCGKMTLTITD